MGNLRLIARLDIKGTNVIKGVHLEGLRVIGDPNKLALKYYEQGADELIFMDSVASLYGRNQLSEIVKKATKDVFIPITVGGGIRSLQDATEILRSGADKVAINTAAVLNPKIISILAQKYGSQCVILSIEAKKNGSGEWEVYTDNGRERSGIDVFEWAQKGVELGAGEILLTSVDQEGTGKGFDLELVEKVSKSVSVPVIASGGMGKVEDVLPVFRDSRADAVAMATILHYERAEINEVRYFARKAQIGVRSY